MQGSRMTTRSALSGYDPVLGPVFKRALREHHDNPVRTALSVACRGLDPDVALSAAQIRVWLRSRDRSGTTRSLTVNAKSFSPIAKAAGKRVLKTKDEAWRNAERTRIARACVARLLSPVDTKLNGSTETSARAVWAALC